MNDADYAKQLIENAARFEAIETMLAHIMATQYYNAQLTPEELSGPHARLIQRFSERTFDGVNPALADHYADEVKRRVEHILALATQQLADARR